MKGLYLLLLCILYCEIQTLAQVTKQNQRITVNYESGQHVQQATEAIEAVNIVGSVSVVEYKAGRSIYLLPGFEAKVGSIFTANIKPVQVENELSLKLTAYPNPFEQSTKIEYTLPVSGKVSLWIVDAQGRKIGQLVNDEDQEAGMHQVEWKPVTIDAGIYIPIIESNQLKVTGRIIKK